MIQTLLAGFWNEHLDALKHAAEAVSLQLGVVPPAPGFLAGLRRLADNAGALLIFDEVSIQLASQLSSSPAADLQRLLNGGTGETVRDREAPGSNPGPPTSL